MSNHPVNLLIRFILELLCLFSSGFWAWVNYDNALRYVLSFGIPVLLAFLWGTFAVKNDPSRSGKAPVPVAGWLRLLMEFAFFSFGIWASYKSGYVLASILFAVIILLHYLVSYDRIIWLLKQKP